ncbi:hypothetical protein PRIPAC_82052 [Pristionchus pacificus]|uniref:Acetyltransferase n=1 Tax=Pristionchus pacificus TaxID=54126 RepID=A0A2A6CLX7_PRIPA|nr:hypothetical protein PRIPAC_82052 [Pristionchus pacificus]|eukprot:PDM79077.1 Acetyltransferase [Pristionchus pacificus]
MPLRAATKDDVSLLYDMIVELATFEKLEHEVVISREQFAKDFDNKIVHGFVVFDDEDGKPAGMVTYSYRYDCWSGRYIYMNELLVRPEYRNKQYGKQLWAAVANEDGVSHINWSVLGWNKRAIAFYDAVSGVVEEKNEEGFLRYRMTREGIQKILGFVIFYSEFSSARSTIHTVMSLREVTTDDLPDVYDMLVELSIFENMRSEMTLSSYQFEKDFEQGYFRGFITKLPAGMALYHEQYHSWKGKVDGVTKMTDVHEYYKLNRDHIEQFAADSEN